MSNTRLALYEHGYMLTDYFNGTSGVQINTYIDNTTTIREVIERLGEESDLLWDHIECVAEHHGMDMCQLEKEFGLILDEMRDKNKDRLNEVLDSTIEIQDGGDTTSYLIFSWEFLED